MKKSNTADRLLLATWFAAVSVPIAVLMANHFLAWKEPETGAVRRLGERYLASAGDQWRMVHVLGGDCRCSEQVMKSLIARGPSSEAREVIVIAGQNAEMKAGLAKAGFEVASEDPEQLVKTYGVNGLPMLTLFSPGGKVAYAGGYSDRRPSPREAIRDVAILRSAKQGRAVAALPIFGCANGAASRKLVDPTGVKYGR